MCGLRPCTKQAICIIEHSNSQLTALWCPAEITVSQCNCLQQYKHTDPVTGMYFEVTNGSCIDTDLGDLPWCYVSASTCSGQPLLRNGYFFDTCYPTGVPSMLTQTCLQVTSGGLDLHVGLQSCPDAQCELALSNLC